MQDKSTYLLSADNESEMDDWIGTLNKILHSSFEQAMQERRNGELHDGAFLCGSVQTDYYFLVLYIITVTMCLKSWLVENMPCTGKLVGYTLVNTHIQ